MQAPGIGWAGQRCISKGIWISTSILHSASGSTTRAVRRHDNEPYAVFPVSENNNHAHTIITHLEFEAFSWSSASTSGLVFEPHSPLPPTQTTAGLAPQPSSPPVLNRLPAAAPKSSDESAPNSGAVVAHSAHCVVQSTQLSRLISVR